MVQDFLFLQLLKSKKKNWSFFHIHNWKQIIFILFFYRKRLNINAKNIS